MKFYDLPWRSGFGGIMKAEFYDRKNRLWTVLECDDGAYTIYCIDNGASPAIEGLNTKQVEFILNLIEVDDESA